MCCWEWQQLFQSRVFKPYMESCALYFSHWIASSVTVWGKFPRIIHVFWKKFDISVFRVVHNCERFPVPLTHEGCSEHIQPFRISRELVTWPWCNLAGSQRRPYCLSVNSHSPVGLVSWQWDAVDWACVLCDRHIHNDWASRSASSWQCPCPFYSSRAGFFGKASHQPGPCDFWLFPKLKSPLKRRRFVNVTVTQYTSSVSGVSLPTD